MRQPVVVDSEPAVPVPVTRGGAASESGVLAQEIERARAACAELRRVLVVERPTTRGPQDRTPHNMQMILRCILEQ